METHVRFTVWGERGERVIDVEIDGLELTFREKEGTCEVVRSHTLKPEAGSNDKPMDAHEVMGKDRF